MYEEKPKKRMGFERLPKFEKPAEKLKKKLGPSKTKPETFKAAKRAKKSSQVEGLKLMKRAEVLLTEKDKPVLSRLHPKYGRNFVPEQIKLMEASIEDGDLNYKKLASANKQETIKDVESLLYINTRGLKKSERSKVIGSLSGAGLLIDIDKKTGEIKQVSLSELARKKGLNIESLEGLESELTKEEYQQFIDTIHQFEHRYTKRNILQKVVSRKEGQQALLKGKLTEAKVMVIAQKIADEGDEEMGHLIRREAELGQINTNRENEKAQADILKTAKSAPKKYNVLESTFSHKPAEKLKAIVALHSINLNLANCEVKDGKLSFNAPGIKYVPTTIFIVPKGFEVESVLFSFNQLDAAIQGLRGKDELSKSNDAGIAALAQNPTRNNWAKDIWTASKLFEVAKSMPEMAAKGLPNKLKKMSPKERFRILMGQIAKIPPELFKEFRTGVDNVKRLVNIKNNIAIKMVLEKIFPSERSPEKAKTHTGHGTTTTPKVELKRV